MKSVECAICDNWSEHDSVNCFSGKVICSFCADHIHPLVIAALKSIIAPKNVSDTLSYTLEVKVTQLKPVVDSYVCTSRGEKL